MSPPSLFWQNCLYVTGSKNLIGPSGSVCIADWTWLLSQIQATEALENVIC